MRLICSKLLTSIQGGRVARTSPGSSESQVGPTLDRMSFHHRATHTHTHSDWDSADTLIHLWDMGGNLSPRRKPLQRWGDRANSTQTVAPARNQFLPPSTHQHYNEMTLDKRAFCLECESAFILFNQLWAATLKLGAADSFRSLPSLPSLQVPLTDLDGGGDWGWGGGGRAEIMAWSHLQPLFLCT